MTDIPKTTEEEAIARAKKQPRRERDGYVCIGGIGQHGECYGHGASAECPYCITPEAIATGAIREEKK